MGSYCSNNRQLSIKLNKNEFGLTSRIEKITKNISTYIQIGLH